MDALKKHFPTWQYALDLDEVVTRYAGNPAVYGGSATWTRDVQEAYDVTLSEPSAAGISLLDRMLLEADYFFEHGIHLDIINVTRCVHSYDSNDMIPNADWFNGKFCITQSSKSSRDDKFGSRSTHYSY